MKVLLLNYFPGEKQLSQIISNLYLFQMIRQNKAGFFNHSSSAVDSHFLRGHFSRRGSSSTGGASLLLLLHAIFLSHHISPTHYWLAHWFSGPLSLGLSHSLNLSESTFLPAHTNPSIFQFLFFPFLMSLLSITGPFALSSVIPLPPPFFFLNLLLTHGFGNQSTKWFH